MSVLPGTLVHTSPDQGRRDRERDLRMSREQPPPAYLSVAQAAAHWGLDEHAIRRRIARGELPAVRLSARCLRIRREDVEAMGRPVQTGTTGTEPEAA